MSNTGAVKEADAPTGACVWVCVLGGALQKRCGLRASCYKRKALRAGFGAVGVWLEVATRGGTLS